MKTLKFLFVNILLGLLIFMKPMDILKADEDPPGDQGCELWIINYDTHLHVKFYPVGTIFNGITIENPTPKYTLKSAQLDMKRKNDPQNEHPLRYLVGLDRYALDAQNPWGIFHTFQYGETLHFDHNSSGTRYEIDGLYGYGKYMLEIYDASFEFLLAIPIDWMDFGYAGQYPGAPKDVEIVINDAETNDITFQWCSPNLGQVINLFDTRIPINDRGKIKVYRQYHW